MCILVIIYNHNFSSNIDRVENVYKSRFSKIFHLVPFYDGDKANVIPVYESSHYFQGYVSQSIGKFYDSNVKHYFFIADDLLLNPLVNEHNYNEYLGIDDEASWIEELVDLSSLTKFWSRATEAIKWKPQRISGVEIISFLPSKNIFLQRSEKYNIKSNKISFRSAYPSIFFLIKIMIFSLKTKNFGLLISNIYKSSAYLYLPNYFKKFKTQYNLVGAYSDIFVVSSKDILYFAHLSGMFAATNLFVELAIPTALIHSSNNLRTSSNSRLSGKAIWSSKELLNIEKKFDLSLNKLLDNFPINQLYFHPIKLSKWSD